MEKTSKDFWSDLYKDYRILNSSAAYYHNLVWDSWKEGGGKSKNEDCKFPVQVAQCADSTCRDIDPSSNAYMGNDENNSKEEEGGEGEEVQQPYTHQNTSSSMGKL